MSWRLAHWWKSSAKWISLWLNFEHNHPDWFKKKFNFCHIFSTASWNLSKTIMFFTTTSTPYSILFLSNLPSFSSMSGTIITHQHSNSLLSELGYVFKQWSMQHIATSLHFSSFMIKQSWCYLRRKRSVQKSTWRAWHVLRGKMDSCSLMGPSLHFLRSLNYIARHGSIRIKTILSTVRCIWDSLA